MDEPQKKVKHVVGLTMGADGKIEKTTFSVGDVVTYKPIGFHIVSVDNGVIMGLNLDNMKAEVVQLDFHEIEHLQQVKEEWLVKRNPELFNEVTIVEEPDVQPVYNSADFDKMFPPTETFEQFDERINNLEKAVELQRRLLDMVVTDLNYTQKTIKDVLTFKGADLAIRGVAPVEPCNKKIMDTFIQGCN